jgi:biopolymer transport protein ExbB
MQYNWLMRRNKAIGEELMRFANDVHGYMMSGGTIRPAVAAPRAAAAKPAAAATTGGAATTGAAGTSTTKTY